MTTGELPFGATAVMARRVEAVDSLDCFPTPPWATRALTHIVLPKLGVDLAEAFVWEPAAGLGHMAAPLREAARQVLATDVFDYGPWLDATGDFLTADLVGPAPDWIITNPPFNRISNRQGRPGFLARACAIARQGVAFLCRLALLESHSRYALYRHLPPEAVAVFNERVPMVKGRWDPDATTATAYAWFVWRRQSPTSWARQEAGVDPRDHIRLMLLPPVCRADFHRRADLALAGRRAPGCEPPGTLLDVPHP